MKASLFLSFIIIASMLCIFAPLAYSQSDVLSNDLNVKSYTYYTSPETGALLLVGELQNTGSETFHNAIVTAYIYNVTGEFLSEPASAKVYADQILPGDTAPFSMYFTSSSSATGDLSWVPNIGRIEFATYGKANSTQFDFGLVIAANMSSVDATGKYTVNGLILNTGDTYPEKCYIAGTFYDVAGNVVAIGVSNYIANYLAPDSSAQFSLGLSDASPSAPSQIASYKLRTIAVGIPTITPPSPSPSSILPSTSASTTPVITTTISAAPSDPSDATFFNTLYIIILVMGIIVVIVVLAFLLRRR